MLKAVILDVDGTLIDSNDAHAQAFHSAFHQLGENVPYERIRKLIGKGGDQLIPEAAGWPLDSPKIREVAEIKKQIFQQEHLPHLHPFPGVRELLEKMKHQGLDLVVATAASLSDLGSLLNQAEIRDLLSDCTSRDDVDQAKPAPDVILSALQKLHASPDEVLFLGDTPYDLAAAQQAKVDMIALECGGWNREHFNNAKAVYKDPAHLLSEYTSSPFCASS